MRTRALALLAAAFFASQAPALQAQQTVLTLWAHGTPEPPQVPDAEIDTTKPTDSLFNGRRSQRLTNVTKPTMTLYQPTKNNTGVAALVFPGGGYVRLAWNGEGTDTCEWLNSIGVTCLLVKYRVPEVGKYPANYSDLEDAQQAMRLARQHAAEWHFNANRIGVVGFSAGGNLAVLLSTHPDDAHVMSTPAAADVPTVNGTPIDARANFAIIGYPAYLTPPPAETELDPVYTPNAFTPVTFLIQAENDKSYSKNAIVYYRALMDAHIQAELHYYATGGHGFGIHPTGTPEEHWTALATFWLHTSGIIPRETTRTDTNGTPGSGISQPCPVVEAQPPVAGRPPRPNPNPNNTDNPCP